jgi:hypothetical protein
VREETPAVPLALVIHDLPAGSDPAKAMFDAIYEIAPEHWPISDGALLAATGVSPAYLRDHLRRALKAGGYQAGIMLVTRLGDKAAWSGLPPEGEAWLREMIE